MTHSNANEDSSEPINVSNSRVVSVKTVWNTKYVTLNKAGQLVLSNKMKIKPVAEKPVRASAWDDIDTSVLDNTIDYYIKDLSDRLSLQVGYIHHLIKDGRIIAHYSGIGGRGKVYVIPGWQFHPDYKIILTMIKYSTGIKNGPALYAYLHHKFDRIGGSIKSYILTDSFSSISEIFTDGELPISVLDKR